MEHVDHEGTICMQAFDVVVWSWRPNEHDRGLYGQQHAVLTAQAPIMLE